MKKDLLRKQNSDTVHRGTDTATESPGLRYLEPARYFASATSLMYTVASITSPLQQLPASPSFNSHQHLPSAPRTSYSAQHSWQPTAACTALTAHLLKKCFGVFDENTLQHQAGGREIKKLLFFCKSGDFSKILCMPPSPCSASGTSHPCGSQVGLREMSPLPWISHSSGSNTRCCPHVLQASGTAHDSFPPEHLTVPARHAVQTRSALLHPARSDSTATSSRPGSTRCASHKDSHLGDGCSYKNY